MQIQQNEKLSILGAVYGRKDVTDIVRGLVEKGLTQIRADNENFSDSLYGVTKTLAIVYQYGTQAPVVLAVKEGNIACISPNQHNHQGWYGYQQGQITILGAAYGPLVVTDKVVKRMKDGGLDTTASNDVFGDSWPGVHKVLTVVYRDLNGTIMTAITEEGHRIKIAGGQKQYHQQIPTILGAAYGKYNITDQVSAMVADGCLQLEAENNLFGDGLENVEKSLVVVYRFGHGTPHVGIAREHQTLTFKQSDQFQQFFTEPGQARILGAAYGLADVTTKVASYLQNFGLNIAADNRIFGDSWPGVHKTLVVVYQDAQGNLNTAIVEEHEQLKISFEQQKQQQISEPQQAQYGNNVYQQYPVQPQYGGQQVYFGANPQYVAGAQQQQQYNGQSQPQYNNGHPQYTVQPQYGNYNYQQQTAQPQYGQYGGYQPQGSNGQQQYNPYQTKQ